LPQLLLVEVASTLRTKGPIFLKTLPAHAGEFDFLPAPRTYDPLRA